MFCQNLDASEVGHRFLRRLAKIWRFAKLWHVFQTRGRTHFSLLFNNFFLEKKNKALVRLGANCRNSPSHWSRAIVNKFIDNENDVPCNTTLAMSEKKIYLLQTIAKLEICKYSKLWLKGNHSTAPRGYVHRGRHFYDQ